MTEWAERLACLISLENGKALVDARGEVAYAAEFFRWYAEEAVRDNGELTTAPSGANRILVVRQPIGVGVLVTPWNFPAAMATRKIGPALAAGCAVVLKPASDTPLTALAMAAMLAEAGVPDGRGERDAVAQLRQVVSAMLHDPRVRKLSFTGSTEVGRILLAEARTNVVNYSMELGGNAPFVVFDDADLDEAVEARCSPRCATAERHARRRTASTSRSRSPPPFSERLAVTDGGAAGRARHRAGHPGRPAGQRGHRPRPARPRCRGRTPTDRGFASAGPIRRPCR